MKNRRLWLVFSLTLGLSAGLSARPSNAGSTFSRPANFHNEFVEEIRGGTLTEQKLKNYIRQGLDLDGYIRSQKWQKNSTPLEWAIEFGQEDIVAMLVKNGANLNVEYASGKTPLIYAIIARSDMVRRLLELGADPNYGPNDFTPLSWSILIRDHEIEELLTDYGAKANLDELKKEIVNGTLTDKRLKKYIGLGLNINNHKFNLDQGQFTPLQFAIILDYPQMVRLLLENGADLNQIADDKHTPLTFAVASKSKDAVGILLELGADPNLPDGSNLTPLQRSAKIREGCLQIEEILVSRGATARRVDKNGISPLADLVWANQGMRAKHLAEKSDALECVVPKWTVISGEAANLHAEVLEALRNK